MEKQKILIVHNYYQIPGGEDTVVANERKMLEQNGHEVLLYSRNNSEIKSFSRIKKWIIPFINIFNIKSYREAKRIIKEQKIDVVHVHNTLSLVSPSVYYAAFHCKTPVIQTLHNFRLICPGATLYRDGHICEDCTQFGLMCAIKYGCYRGSRIQTLACVLSIGIHRLIGTYRRIYFICLTEFNKEKILKFRQISPEQIFVKSNFSYNETSVIPYDQRENKLVYVGRIDKLKGIHILLNAWKILSPNTLELNIYGAGPLEDWCKQFIEENHLENVNMLGTISNEDIRKVIASSKALILATQWYEGFPMTLVESFSVGTPVIGSNIGNIEKLILEGVNGWKFKCDSSLELARAISQLRDVVKTTHSSYLQKYTVLINYTQLLEIYTRILK